MSNVHLSIGGRTYTVACDEGEEGRVTALGRLIESKVQALGGAAGHTEARLLLFVSLLLADELQEARSALPRSPGLPLDNPADDDAARLEAIAARLESCAEALED